ncbi:MAG: PorT family protein [Treponema sp.]|nr:PorT family protein [Treponema sp.]
MKKLIAAAAALLISGFAFAQGLTLEVGGRASFDLNIFDFKNGDFDSVLYPIGEDTYKKVDLVDELKATPGFGINVFANIGLPFLEGLGIQPEIGFHYHNVAFKPSNYSYNGDLYAFSYEWDDDMKGHYMTLDIPVLVTYKIGLGDMFFIRPEVGPKFSFTLGKFTVEDNKLKTKATALGQSVSETENIKDDDYDVKSAFNFGFEAGVCFGINLGPGAILIDVRYTRDFTKMTVEDFEFIDTKIGDFDFGSGQSINVSAGYSIKVM